jgi:hypothetical protein
VNEATQRVSGDHAQEPQDQQDDGDGHQHREPPFL